MGNPEFDYSGIDVLPARQESGFVERPDLEVLLGDSAHHVRVQEDEFNALWIVKPTTRAKAFHERDMYEKLSRDGVPVPKFAGRQSPYVETNDNGDCALILPFVAGLQPMTRQNWQAFPYTQEFEERKDLVKRLFGLAAKLHLRGYVHGDFQIKNIGSIPGGRLVLYDLENTENIENTDDSQREQMQADDLVSICKSLMINRFLEHGDVDLKKKTFEDLVQHYVEKRKPVNFDPAFRTAGIALDKLDQTLSDPDWLAKARARFLASRTKG